MHIFLKIGNMQELCWKINSRFSTSKSFQVIIIQVAARLRILDQPVFIHSLKYLNHVCYNAQKWGHLTRT